MIVSFSLIFFYWKYNVFSFLQVQLKAHLKLYEEREPVLINKLQRSTIREDALVDINKNTIGHQTKSIYECTKQLADMKHETDLLQKKSTELEQQVIQVTSVLEVAEARSKFLVCSEEPIDTIFTCGHMLGISCISRIIQTPRAQGGGPKCPVCNKMFEACCKVFHQWKIVCLCSIFFGFVLLANLSIL
jgi:Zinc finger, C3HC4 type (RING finger)